jgi:hypothetical protein
MISAIGAIVSGWDVEIAVLQTIELWLATYLSEIERQVFNASGSILPRPDSPDLQLPDNEGNHSIDPTSIHGGVDFLTSASVLMPEIIITVQPVDNPEYLANGDYCIEFDLTIACQAMGEDETLARMYASLYGSAITALIIQNGDLNGIATRTRLTGPPHTEFVDTADADDAQLVQAVSVFSIYVDSSVNDHSGLAEPVTGDTLDTPDPTQLPPDWPTTSVVNMAFAYVRLADELSDASFE